MSSTQLISWFWVLLIHALSGSIDADGTSIVLETCSEAIAAGDGRELWQQGPGGQITNVLSKKCMGLKSAEEGAAVLLTDCDKAESQWEVQGNGIVFFRLVLLM